MASCVEERDMTDKYYKTKEENGELKKTIQSLLTQVKAEKVKTQRMVKSGSGSRDRESNELIKAMEEETEHLKRRLSELQDVVRIQSQSGGKSRISYPASARRPRSAKVVTKVKKTTKSTGKVKKKLPEKATKNVKSMKKIKEILTMIGNRMANPEETNKLVQLPRHAEESEMNSDIAALQRQLRESRAKVNLLQHQFDQVQAGLQAGKQVHKHALEQVEKYKLMLQTAEKNQHSLRSRIKELEMGTDQLDNLNLIIDDLRATNKSLHEQVENLTNNAFLSDQAESGRIRKIVTDFTAKVADLEAQLLIQQNQARNATELSEKARSQIEERDGIIAQLTSDKMQAEMELSRAQKKIVALEERMMIFSSDSGVKLEELDRALDLVRRQKELDPEDGTSEEGFEKSIPAMQRQLRKLEMENKDLLVELRSKEDMLRMQAHLDMQVQKEHRDLQEELNRLKRDYFDAMRRVHQPMARAESVLSDMSLLSQLSLTSLHGSENLVVLRISDAKFDSPLFKSASPLTFVSVGFYDFETTYSSIFAGSSVSYGVTAQYKVDCDDLFIQWLSQHQACARLEVFMQRGVEEIERIGICKIPVSGLLEYSAKVKDSFTVYTSESDAAQPIGKISVVMKMYRPVVSIPGSYASSVSSHHSDERHEASEPEEDEAASADEQIAKSENFEQPVADVEPSQNFTSPSNATTTRISLTVRDVNDIYAKDMQLIARNLRYGLDQVAQRVTTFQKKDGSDEDLGLGCFVIELESSATNLAPEEDIRLELMKDEELQGIVSLPLSLVSNSSTGECEESFAVFNEKKIQVGSITFGVDWITSETSSL